MTMTTAIIGGAITTMIAAAAIMTATAAETTATTIIVASADASSLTANLTARMIANLAGRRRMQSIATIARVSTILSVSPRSAAAMTMVNIRDPLPPLLNPPPSLPRVSGALHTLLEPSFRTTASIILLHPLSERVCKPCL